MPCKPPGVATAPVAFFPHRTPITHNLLSILLPGYSFFRCSRLCSSKPCKPPGIASAPVAFFPAEPHKRIRLSILHPGCSLFRCSRLCSSKPCKPPPAPWAPPLSAWPTCSPRPFKADSLATACSATCRYTVKRMSLPGVSCLCECLSVTVSPLGMACRITCR